MPWMRPPARHYLVVEWAPSLEEYLTLAMVLLGLVLFLSLTISVRQYTKSKHARNASVEFVGSRNDKYVICA